MAGVYLEMLGTYSVRGLPGYTSCKGYTPTNVGHVLHVAGTPIKLMLCTNVVKGIVKLY